MFNLFFKRNFTTVWLSSFVEVCWAGFTFWWWIELLIRIQNLKNSGNDYISLFERWQSTFCINYIHIQRGDEIERGSYLDFWEQWISNCVSFSSCLFYICRSEYRQAMMKNMSSTLVETVSIDYEDFNESFLTCGTCLCK